MNATPDRFATRLVRSVKSRMEMGALLGRQERPQHSESDPQNFASIFIGETSPEIGSLRIIKHIDSKFYGACVNK